MRAALLACLALAACSTSKSPQTPTAEGGRPPARTVTYACEDGGKLTVSFGDGAATLVDSQGRRFQLTQQEAGSGVHYAGQGATLLGKGDEMTWTSSDEAPGLACSAANTPLAGTRWRLVEFRSADPAVGVLTPEAQAVYEMDLIVGGRLAMQLDCNRATGRWETHTSSMAGSISMAAPAMTRALCLHSTMDTRIAGDMDKVRSFAIEGDRLSLTLADGGVYQWRRAP
jgi:membrane-bound inhibitor of C-type lysozyme